MNRLLRLSNLSAMITAAIITPVLSSSVHAALVQLTFSEFSAQTASLTVVTEDFEAFSIGPQPSPFSFRNGQFTSPATSIDAGPSLCKVNDKCLIDQGLVGDRSFSAFPSGTTFWGSDILLVRATDLFDITVVGTSGIIALASFGLGASGPDTFFGVKDDLGLLSVTFSNLGPPGGGGIGNYSFDNVLTVVPIPAALPLFASALIGFGLVGYRRRKARKAA